MRQIILILAILVVVPLTAARCTEDAGSPSKEQPAQNTPNTLEARLARVLPSGAGIYMTKTSADARVTAGSRTEGRKYARDFIFTAYASGEPLEVASITVMQPNGRLGITVTLGAIAASSQPGTTWTDNSVGPTIFIDWMKRRGNGGVAQVDRAFVTGPWAD